MRESQSFVYSTVAEITLENPDKDDEAAIVAISFTIVIKFIRQGFLEILRLLLLMKICLGRTVKRDEFSCSFLPLDLPLVFFFLFFLLFGFSSHACRRSGNENCGRGMFFPRSSKRGNYYPNTHTQKSQWRCYNIRRRGECIVCAAAIMSSSSLSLFPPML